MGFLVAIEGIDGSGKGTQARRLCERLTAAGRRAELISFPRYDATLFGRAVADFLNGRFGALEQVSPFLASLLYAGDRFESRDLLLEAAERNDVVVIDRYVPSNVAHQGAKLDRTERREFVDWIGRIEYDVFSLPAADLVILLDLPAAQARQLIAGKHVRSYTEKAADIHEADTEYLKRVREVYLDLAAGRESWHIVDCMGSHGVRAIDEIAEEIWKVLNDRRRHES